MQVDKTTLSDLSIFDNDESQSIFHLLNFTQTNQGRNYLYYLLSKPQKTIAEIVDVQHTIQQILVVKDNWPKEITNGTLMVVEKFYETPISGYPSIPTFIDSLLYKLLNGYDYSITKYSVTHFIHFIHGIDKLKNLLQGKHGNQLQLWVTKIESVLAKSVLQEILATKINTTLSPATLLKYAHFFRNKFKQDCTELIQLFAILDAYCSLAIAVEKYGFNFPTFVETAEPFVMVDALFHPLLQEPVSYTVQLNKQANFLFLTGANMAGKSTFIKAIGIGVYLAHIGMAVPAKNMQLSLFDGLLSNIHVVDNIMKGESYFFNEVQRIKNTVEKISDGKNWLILIDELFKGTNVQDAMKCSTTVIEGLHKMKNAVFVLSTHLYEIANDLQVHSNIQFKYFETEVANDQLMFSYHLKDGISNDRLGYLILKQEGVVDLLAKL